MDMYSVRDYRNNLAAIFDRALEGERVLIRRKKNIYALVCIGNDDLTISQSQQHRLDELAQSIKRSWRQIKQLEAGELQSKSAMEFIDEL